MSRQLIIGLHNGGKIVMQADRPETEMSFDGLGELLCLRPVSGAGEADHPDVELIPPGSMPEDRHMIRKVALTEIAYDADWSRVLIAGWERQPKNRLYYNCFIWQKSLMLASMNTILRGERIALAHCSVLETEDRRAVLLFGESGMGKSTAFRRWRAEGGKGHSDDMALLDFSGGGGEIFVRRMPTWSACRIGQNEWNYPVGDELRLAGVFALGRSESGRNEIVELSAAQYFAQCYRSIFFWSLFDSNGLPDEMKGRLTECMRENMALITGLFPPRILLTVLDGDLKQLIEDNL